MDYTALHQHYQQALLDDIIPFWTRYSLDEVQGGFFTCLDRTGLVFDTDKFIWLQARQVWTFAMLYQQLGPRPEWLTIARHGADFLEAHGRAPNGDWYFSLRQDGRPLVQPYNIFSDCFACMAFGKLYQITAEARYAEIARSTFRRIWARQTEPKGPYEKSVPGTRPLRSFALPMILCNLALEIEPLLPVADVQTVLDNCVETVMGPFYDPGKGLILENVQPDGQFSDSFEGRLLNPGHAIEAMWFVMDLAARMERPALAAEAVRRGLMMLEKGWDSAYGGIFYFMDALGHPPQQLEWDQKLWWVHLETLVFLAKAIQMTGSQEAARWFELVHRYTWDHFPDPAHGEWYGYLNRAGQPLLDLKGGKWKGCFHVPRALFQVMQSFDAIR